MDSYNESLSPTQLSSIESSLHSLHEKVDLCNSQFEGINNTRKKRSWFSHDGDENEERGNWTGKLDFILSCLGYAVGLGNVWRFPYLCYQNGGGAFLIPYCIMLIFVGIPIFFLELSLGQFSSHGPLTCWGFAPAFKGVGVAMLIVSSLVGIYYNVIIAWAIYYLFASFTSVLPWTECGAWSSELCQTRLSATVNCTSSWIQCTGNGTAYENGTLVGLWNETLAKENDIRKTSPAEEYLEKVVLGISESSGIDDVGSLRWPLCLCLLLAWVLVYVSLSHGIKSSGKVVYFTATFPYVVLLILFIRGITLEGFQQGIEFYITPNMTKLSEAKVWKDAATQIFFSLSASWGGLIALSSYNRFHNDALRDTLVVTLGNCATSVFAGFVIFSYIGHMATVLGVDVKEVAKGGVTLAFVVYPNAVTLLPVSTLWSILFFLMIITLGLDSQFVLVETVTTAIQDQFPKSRKYKSFVILLFCIVLYFLGLLLTTNGGAYWLQLLDHYAGGWNVLIIALCECIAVSYVYGIKRFLRDIGVMLGRDVCGCFSWITCRFWWAACWTVITPIGVLFIFIFSWVDYKDVTYGGMAYPTWANALGWLITLTVVLAIFVTGFIMFCVTPGPLLERFRKLFTPTHAWGPALSQYRDLITHVPGFVINTAAYIDDADTDARCISFSSDIGASSHDVILLTTKDTRSPEIGTHTERHAGKITTYTPVETYCQNGNSQPEIKAASVPGHHSGIPVAPSMPTFIVTSKSEISGPDSTSTPREFSFNK